MSAENVELVRRNFEAIQRAVDAYWRDPRSIVKALDEGTLGPELGGGAGRAFRDFRTHIVEVEDLGGDRVYIVIEPEGVGKDSPHPIDSRIHSIFTVRDGLVIRLEEYTSREEALAASG